MSHTATSKAIHQFVLTCLSGEIPSWPFGDDEAVSETFLELTHEMELQPILLSRLKSSETESTWPEELVLALR